MLICLKVAKGEKRVEVGGVTLQRCEAPTFSAMELTHRQQYPHKTI